MLINMNSLVQSSPLPKEISDIFPVLGVRKRKLRGVRAGQDHPRSCVVVEQGPDPRQAASEPLAHRSAREEISPLRPPSVVAVPSVVRRHEHSSG